MGATVILAAAGAGKTERIVNEALKDPGARVLITTFTNRNADTLRDRIVKYRGVIPPNITVMTWFVFLLREMVKPYQSSFTSAFRTQGINFLNDRPFSAKRGTDRYYFDRQDCIFQDGVADLAGVINENSGGKTLQRLRDNYDHLLIDELQDLAGYDLDLLDLFIGSGITLTMVGDARQATYTTNDSLKHRQYRGFGLYKWIDARRLRGKLAVEWLNHSHRCNALICAFADALYPDQPKTESLNADVTGHDGIFLVSMADLTAYVAAFRPTVLRRNRTVALHECLGGVAANIGDVKGSTFDRVLVYPTNPMLKYLVTGDLAQAGDRERFYVAVTRARHSVAFVTVKSIKSGFGSYWR